MKKWLFIGITILGITTFIVNSINKLPTINGNQILIVKILDINANIVANWSLFEANSDNDRDKIESLISAFENRKPSVERNVNKPNYWVHIGVKNGDTIDYLVWLEDKKQASFLPGSLNNLKFGLGEQSAYPIEDELRDEILKLLRE